ncbi:methyltransferase domain-containing protein, partial [Bombilactobacillus bombi]|uniref:methyltransferase domain-containing protein n=1 Tax=Bombilactobacillus bombi TaxID=1303590 RepID=UPI0015E5ECF9
WFDAGYWTIQDESAMLVTPALQVEKSDRVLDACAAPGGKTTQIASELGPNGQITALDLHAKKLHLIEQNAHRLGVFERLQTQALDARQVGEKFSENSFDKILVDAPCSGLGLMRRKPEIRYTKQAIDINKLAAIQLAILEAVAPLLKPQGLLVYSTCTILEAENQQVITQFLQRRPDFILRPVKTHYPLAEIHRRNFVQIYPDDYTTDGFFIAALQKIK